MSVNPLTTFEAAEIGRKVCEGRMTVTQTDIDTFCALMGYDDPAYRADAPGGAIAPSSMGLTYGLRLGWEESVFPPGAIRMGDENIHGVPARPGDELVTDLTVTDRFERKGRRFLTYRMETRNRTGALVCSVAFTAIVP
ncbi:MaoC family dehydratase [Chachezhania sediminis]|uniref:MaoC family dehydratase n=1 Tax=Chachezhania sediminis TaxID=2599291 RepID=UPI00131BAF80|nr:MaoC family dehydratase [Chachezhania sediminis]